MPTVQTLYALGDTVYYPTPTALVKANISSITVTAEGVVYALGGSDLDLIPGRMLYASDEEARAQIPVTDLTVEKP